MEITVQECIERNDRGGETFLINDGIVSLEDNGKEEK